MPLLPYEVSRQQESKWLAGLQRIERRQVANLQRIYGLALRDVEAEAARLAERLATAESFKGVSEVARLDSETLAFRLQLLRSRKTSLAEAVRARVASPQMIAGAEAAINGSALPAYKFGITTGLHNLSGLAVAHHRVNRDFADRALAKFSSQTNARLWVEGLANGNAQAVVDTLQKGVLLGQNPEVMTAAVRGSLDATRARVSTFVRTEVIGAARQGSLDSYRANADVVTGWIWNAADDACAVCWGMNGTLHPLDEEMDSHPNCRCSPDPTTADYQELQAGNIVGGGSEGIAPFNADERFAALPEARQLRILGPTRYDAFKRGDLSLRDIPAPTHSPHWGAGLRAKTLAELNIARPVAPTPPANVDGITHTEGGAWVDEVSAIRESVGELGLPEALRQAVPNESMARMGPEMYRAALADADAVLAPQVDAVLRAGEVMQTELRARADALLARNAEEKALRDTAVRRTTEKIADTNRMADELAARPRYGGQKADVRKLRMQARDLQGQLDQLAAGRPEERRQAVMEMLREIRPMGDGGRMIRDIARPDSLPAITAQVARMSDYIPRAWLDKMREWAGDRGMRFASEGRGGFYEGQQMITVGRMSSAPGLEPGDTTALHEMIHWAERAVPGLRELEWSFYRRRTTINGVREKRVALRTLQPGHGYGSREFAREDKFSDPYTGKDYGDGPASSYEIATMGTESTIGTAGLGRGIDAEHERFILGLLAMLA